jgi:membrane-associated phospholipid phosphatase
MPVFRVVSLGRTATGFAFAAAIGPDQPSLGLSLRLLAAAVAYSRVPPGVHYPGDAVVGSLTGEGIRQAIGAVMWTGCRGCGRNRNNDQT